MNPEAEYDDMCVVMFGIIDALVAVLDVLGALVGGSAAAERYDGEC